MWKASCIIFRSLGFRYPSRSNPNDFNSGWADLFSGLILIRRKLIQSTSALLCTNAVGKVALMYPLEFGFIFWIWLEQLNHYVLKFFFNDEIIMENFDKCMFDFDVILFWFSNMFQLYFHLHGILLVAFYSPNSVLEDLYKTWSTKKCPMADFVEANLWLKNKPMIVSRFLSLVTWV